MVLLFLRLVEGLRRGTTASTMRYFVAVPGCRVYRVYVCPSFCRAVRRTVIPKEKKKTWERNAYTIEKKVVWFCCVLLCRGLCVDRFDLVSQFGFERLLCPVTVSKNVEEYICSIQIVANNYEELKMNIEEPSLLEVFFESRIYSLTILLKPNARTGILVNYP